jgi:hypothetical protein
VVATSLTFETAESLILPAGPATALLLRRSLGASFRAAALPDLLLPVAPFESAAILMVLPAAVAIAAFFCVASATLGLAAASVPAFWAVAGFFLASGVASHSFDWGSP